jgi:hypothetical protein
LIALLSPWLALEDSRGETSANSAPLIEQADSPLSAEDAAPDEYDEYEECYESFPHFFLPGIETDLNGPEEFQSGLEESRKKAPRQRMKAREIVATLPPGMVLEHTRDLPDLFASR